jgi:hypothetical protein
MFLKGKGGLEPNFVHLFSPPVKQAPKVAFGLTELASLWLEVRFCWTPFDEYASKMDTDVARESLAWSADSRADSSPK